MNLGPGQKSAELCETHSSPGDPSKATMFARY